MTPIRETIERAYQNRPDLRPHIERALLMSKDVELERRRRFLTEMTKRWGIDQEPAAPEATDEGVARNLSFLAEAMNHVEASRVRSSTYQFKDAEPSAELMEIPPSPECELMEIPPGAGTQNDGDSPLKNDGDSPRDFASAPTDEKPMPDMGFSSIEEAEKIGDYASPLPQ